MKLNKTREQIVENILNILEEGEIPFTQKWISPLKNFNAISEQYYNGVNKLLLSMVAATKCLEDPRWVTFKQAKKKGWSVKKGSKGVPIEFWSYYDIKQKKVISVGEAKKLISENEDYKKMIKSVVNTYIVFNAVDIDGIPEYVIEENKNLEIKNTVALSVLDTYLDQEQVSLIHKGYNAFYNINKDEITLPRKTFFKTEYDYISVLAHEICHSTGNEKRMNREIDNSFKTQKYALEELRAEIGSTFLCSDLDLECSELDLQNHKSYIKNWIQIINDTPTELFKAINDSKKICDYVLEKGDHEHNKLIEIKFDDELSYEEKDLGFSLERVK